MKAIDVHAHLPTREYIVDAGGDLMAAAVKYFHHESVLKTIDEMIDEYKSCNVERVVLLGWNAETGTGSKPVKNELIAKIVRDYADFFIGFASVDPWKGKKALEEIKRAISRLELNGLKFHQIAQRFYPDDNRFAKLWKLCVELDVPVIFHVGSTGLGAGLDGGGGLQLDYARPIPYIDNVAAKYPELRILCAHPGFPWEKELLAICVQKNNVYMDLSGYLPKYIAPEVIRYANTVLKDKVMFGTDYPFITPQRWLESFNTLDIKEESREKILYKNARKFLFDTV